MVKILLSPSQVINGNAGKMKTLLLKINCQCIKTNHDHQLVYGKKMNHWPVCLNERVAIIMALLEAS